MSNTASGTTSFVLGREQDGNREVRVFTDGQAYDIDPAAIQAYSSQTTAFPYTA